MKLGTNLIRPIYTYIQVDERMSPNGLPDLELANILMLEVWEKPSLYVCVCVAFGVAYNLESEWQKLETTQLELMRLK